MRHKAGLLFFIVLAAAAVIICSGCLGGQQKYIGYSVLGGFSKMSQKSFSKVLFHPDLQQKPMIALTFDDGPKAGVTDVLLDEVEKKRYTIVANGAFFQFPLCRDSVSFIGTVKETGENFFYRIYDRELFLHIMHRLRAVKREKTPAEAKAVLPKCRRHE